MLHFRQGRELARKLLQLWKRKHQVPLGAQAVGHAAPSLMEALGAAQPVGQYLLPKSIPDLLAPLVQLSENCITCQSSYEASRLYFPPENQDKGAS